VVLPVWAVILVSRKRRRAAALAACLALPPLVFVLLVENRLFSNPPTVAPGYLRLIHWNVAGALNRPGASDVLLAQRADLYVLSEVPNARSVEVFAEAVGPEYQSRVFGNLSVVGAGSVQAHGWLLERDGAKVQSVTWERGGDRVALFVVDLPSRIDVARDPLLREVNGSIERHRPDLVVGDFNAPRRSRALCELPAGYGHAYDAVGSGFGYTWPVPAPMYALDQCIHSARIVPARYELISSRFSDHRLQVFDFFWSPGG
jgi:endonuclease/exonuclease/phosphatase (EEP) superfamily protein YafD